MVKAQVSGSYIEPPTRAFVVSLGRKGIRKASRRYEGIRTAVVLLPVLIVVERTQDPGRIVGPPGVQIQRRGRPGLIIEQAVSAFGHIDILVANHARSSAQNLEQLTAGELDLSYAVNTRATLLLVKEFAAQHKEERPGRIILMTSGQHRGPMPAELPYVGSKGALHQLTTSLAAHLAPRNITVNTIDPGATDTGYADEQRQEVIALKPMGRWGEPDDAARLIAWLTGGDSCWVTGQVIVSSGGRP